MTKRKGELSPAALDRGWPYQVALKELDARGHYERHDQIKLLLRQLSAAPRGHTVCFEAVVYNVYCFAKPEDARTFQEWFGGEPFDPRDKGKGAQWSSWFKGRAAAKDALKRQ